MASATRCDQCGVYGGKAAYVVSGGMLEMESRSSYDFCSAVCARDAFHAHVEEIGRLRAEQPLLFAAGS